MKPDTTPLPFTDLPIRAAQLVATLGPTVVIIPHPDDESLGCGGLLALLRQAQVPVTAVLVTDGTMSHPHSQKFPPAARQALRAAELREALTILGVDTDRLLSLGLPDGAAPGATDAGFAEATTTLSNFFTAHQPATVLVPWRRDPHPDHRATSQLVAASVAQSGLPLRRLEYVVWAWERAAPADLPQPGEVTGWRLDVSSVLPQKQRAIAAHRSQLTNLIDDDPTGFQLAPAMLAHFSQPFEVYFDCPTWPTPSSQCP